MKIFSSTSEHKEWGLLRLAQQEWFVASNPSNVNLWEQGCYLHKAAQRMLSLRSEIKLAVLQVVARGWSVRCSLHKSTDRTTGRPWFQLDTIQYMSRDGNKRANIEIAGHLKMKESTKSSASQQGATDSIHSEMRQLRHLTSTMAASRPWSAPADFVSALRADVLRFLPQSQLASVLDLWYLEVKWHDIKTKETCSVNTFLNDDGTVRSASIRTSEMSLLDYHNSSMMVERAHPNTGADQVLPESSQDPVGGADHALSAHSHDAVADADQSLPISSQHTIPEANRTLSASLPDPDDRRRVYNRPVGVNLHLCVSRLLSGMHPY